MKVAELSHVRQATRNDL